MKIKIWAVAGWLVALGLLLAVVFMPRAGRYEMHMMGQLRIDTATGKTWVLSDGSWRPVAEKPDGFDPSRPYELLANQPTKRQ